MTELKKKPLFNPEGDPDVRLRRMISGNTTNLNDFNNMKYAWVSDWYRQAMNNFWIPEEINLSQDVKDYPRLLSAERSAYDKILSFLVFLDSIQTANLPNIGAYITANEVNLCLSTLLSGDRLTGVRLRDTVTGEESVVDCDGVFVSVGRQPATALAVGQLALDGGGYIVAGETTETSIPGVYAVGDVRTKPLRQVVTAVADGAVAVHMAEKYIAENR